MKNINAQIKAMREIGTEAGLASLKRKDMLARGVKAVNDMQSAVGPSSFKDGLETLRVNFYETAMAAYLYPNEPTSDLSLQNALAVIERSTKKYDSREKAAYDSTRSAWSAIRSACGVKDASRSQGATKAAQARAENKEAVKSETAPEAAKPVKVRTSKAFYEGFAMLIGQGSAFCESNQKIIEHDKRAELIEIEFKKFAQAVNEILLTK